MNSSSAAAAKRAPNGLRSKKAPPADFRKFRTLAVAAVKIKAPRLLDVLAKS